MIHLSRNSVRAIVALVVGAFLGFFVARTLERVSGAHHALHQSSHVRNIIVSDTRFSGLRCEGFAGDRAGVRIGGSVTDDRAFVDLVRAVERTQPDVRVIYDVDVTQPETPASRPADIDAREGTL